MTTRRPVNPYVAGAPLRNAQGFFGRQDVLEWVERELCNPGTNALVLFGQRRIGKTTLLLQLQRLLPAGTFLPIYFDLQDQARYPLGRVLADLAATIANQVALEPPTATVSDDAGRFFHQTFLPQLYSAIKDRRPVFLLDEFDVLDQVADAMLPETAAAKSLFPFLRNLMNQDPRPALVFVVGRQAQDLSMDFMATFKASLVKEIWVLDPASAQALVRQAETNGTLSFTDRAVDSIFHLTNGHPYLTQLLCQRIWERAYETDPATPPAIDAQEVEAAVDAALAAGDSALVWLWNGLSPAEKIYAAALAETAGEEETIHEDRIVEVLAANAARLRSREVEQAANVLVKRRVLENVGGQEYRFAVRLFQRWVRTHKPLRDVKDELDHIEPFADQLYRVGQHYFDQRQWDKAIRSFHDALKENSRHFRARLNLGEALLNQGQFDEAVTELDQAFQLDQEMARLPLARALIAQAQARERSRDEPGALAACERALQLSPNEQKAREIRAKIWERQGEALRQMKRWAEAATLYEQLLLQPPHEDKRSAWQAALNQCRAEEELARYFDEGAKALKQGDLEQAKRALSKLLTSCPDYKKDGRLAVDLLQQAVKGEQAIASRRRWIRIMAIGALLLTAALLIAVFVSRQVNESRRTTPSAPAVLPTASPTPTLLPTSTSMPSPTDTATPAPSYTSTATASPTATLTPTKIPTATLTPTRRPTRTPTATSTPTLTPIPNSPAQPPPPQETRIPNP